MTLLSPAAAAFEGLRTMRRHPVAVLAWAAFSLVMLPLLGLQVIGRPGAERTLFRSAAKLEERGLTGVSSPGGAFQGDYR